MRVLLFSLIVLAIHAFATPVQAAKIAVLQVSAKTGFDQDSCDLFTEFVQDELRKRGHDVVGRSDIDALLNLERMKDIVSCTDRSCLAEIAGALGVEEIVHGVIGTMDPYLLVTIKRINGGKVIKQTARKLRDGDNKPLLDAIPSLVDDLYGPVAAASDEGSAPSVSLTPDVENPGLRFPRLRNFSIRAAVL